VRVALATGFGLGLLGGVALGQFTSATSVAAGGSGSASPVIFKGTVLNRITRAPVGRALVFSSDQQLAMMTDDRGRFEFKIGGQPDERSGDVPAATGTSAGTTVITTRFFQVRKPGYLDSGQAPVRDASSSGDTTIYLQPEALIVGKIDSGDAEHVLRFQVQLYRQEFREGQEHWQQAGTFTTWSDGEFRFAGLAAGAYKVITLEQIDQGLFGLARGQEFGYPATFYPGMPDFASSGGIRVAAGETFDANFTVRRRPYYPVRIPVTAGDGEQGIKLVVYPLGHPGPGFSLGYEPGEQAIVGRLPDGGFTVGVMSFGANSAAGMTNFLVQGSAVQGADLNLVPNATMTVNVKEEFKYTSTASPQPPPQIGQIPRGIGPKGPALELELHPTEDFGLTQQRNSRQVGDSTDTLELANVVPGRYTVRALPTRGYAASVLCGGVELLRQPLVVGLGGISSPIEVTLRDDGAEVQGDVEDDDEASPTTASGSASMKTTRYIYFVPMPGSTGQYRQTASNSQGAFIESQLPPGDYLVVAFAGSDPNLHLSFADAVAKYSAAGQVISLAPEQKLQLHLKTIAEEH
jgi:hypothetical protein